MGGMSGRDTAPRSLRPTFAVLAALALALAVVAMTTPAHGAATDEVTLDELGSEASSFVVDAGEPGEETEAECVDEDEEIDEMDAGDEEAGEEESDEAEEAEEECEAEMQDTGSLPPEECLLRTTSARVFTHDGRDEVHLVLRYSALAPTDVTIEYRLKGGKGALRLGAAHKHFGQRGVFRATESLNESQMARVRAARSFDVRLRVAGAPAFCSSYLSRHLTIRRGGPNHAIWSEPSRPAA
jgi:hypothetical protein